MAEGLAVLSVTVHIALKLRRPVLLVSLWTYSLNAPWMLMPEAPMNKDNRVVLRKDYIRTARKIPAVNPKAKPQAVQNGSKYHFRLGVSRADAAHVPASSLGCQLVCHLFRTSVLK